MYVAGSCPAEGGRGGGFGGFFAVAALGEVVVGLAGDFGSGVRGEGTVGGSATRRESFGAEFRDCFVADEDAGFVL